MARIRDPKTGLYVSHLTIENAIDRSGGEDACWPWLFAKDRYGYGQLMLNWSEGRGKRRNKALRAHRWAYEQLVGPIPSGLFLCHSCDNPACCNPKHLWLGTHSQNMLDCARKGRLNSQVRARQRREQQQSLAPDQPA